MVLDIDVYFYCIINLSITEVLIKKYINDHVKNLENLLTFRCIFYFLKLIFVLILQK